MYQWWQQAWLHPTYYNQVRTIRLLYSLGLFLDSAQLGCLNASSQLECLLANTQIGCLLWDAQLCNCCPVHSFVISAQCTALWLLFSAQLGCLPGSAKVCACWPVHILGASWSVDNMAASWPVHRLAACLAVHSCVLACLPVHIMAVCQAVHSIVLAAWCNSGIIAHIIYCWFWAKMSRSEIYLISICLYIINSFAIMPLLLVYRFL